MSVRRPLCSRSIPSLALALVILAGCGKAAEELEAAQSLEATGDLSAAISAYDAVAEAHPHSRHGDEARDAAQAARKALADAAVAGGAPGFELPEGCELGAIDSVEQAPAGALVTISLECGGQIATTSGRVITAEKVWDLTPVGGVLAKEGYCVFISHGNPLGDWALQVQEKECQAQKNLRQGTLDRLGTETKASFECDCRLGEARFEIPRGDPGWRKPPMIYTDKEGKIVDPPL